MSSKKTRNSEMHKDSMDHYRRSSLNCFAAHPIERVHEKRRDDKWVTDRLKDPSTLFIPVWRSKNLFTEAQVPCPVLLSRNDLGDLIPMAESTILLGVKDGGAYFAIDLPSHDSSLLASFAGVGRFRDLRGVGALLDCREGGLLAYARAMTYWHRHHRFCGDCGAATRSAEAGHMRVCTQEQCGQQHFPRTDPAIIVLATSGEHCLLARQGGWPVNLYSTIAGFVEPGESVEDAVVREVREETGIQVKEVHYRSSQPWPFPCSIMLGFTAHTRSKHIRLDDEELEDARWFTRKEVQSALKKGMLQLPPRISIAYRLIEDWFESDGSVHLEVLMSSVTQETASVGHGKSANQPT